MRGSVDFRESWSATREILGRSAHSKLRGSPRPYKLGFCGGDSKMGGFLSTPKFDPAEVQMALEKAKEIVASEAVVVFSKTYCPYCTRAKKLLTQLGARFKVIELDTESDGSKIQSALAEWTGQRTVPNVFIGGKHIGGCDTVTGLNNEGKLVPLLIEAGALAGPAA